MAKDLRTLTFGGESMNAFQCIGSFNKDWTLGNVPSGTTGYTFTAWTATQKCIVMGWAYVSFPAKSGGWRRLTINITNQPSAAQKISEPEPSVTGFAIPICAEINNGGNIEFNISQTSGSGLTGITVRLNIKIFTPRT